MLFGAILEACRGLPVQLVLALGRRDAVWDQPVPGNAIVVPYAPQLELIRRATLVITHAGLNTALETLAAGVPMVCLPITNDQPGVAERVRWLGAGEVLKPSRATAGRLRSLIETVMKSSNHRRAAQTCRERLQQSPTVHDAARLLEEKLAA